MKLIIVIIGPILGTIVNIKGFKKPIFAFSMIVGVLRLACLSIPKNCLIFLTVLVIAKVGYNTSLIFYNSMLSDVKTNKRIDVVSSNGYAWGYIGSCNPFVVGYFLFNKSVEIK